MSHQYHTDQRRLRLRPAAPAAGSGRHSGSPGSASDAPLGFAGSMGRIETRQPVGNHAGMNEPIKTRFAPSPTGHLHIGGARTALYNWLFARRMQGRFVLRIEDTDVERNVAGAEAKIAQDLEWLGLTPDESPWTGGPDGPYRQSERLEIYAAYAQRLVDSGHAYYTFDTPEELAAMRDRAKAEKRSFRYPRPTALPGKADADRAAAQGRPVVVRMKSPDRDVTVDDRILGAVTIRAEEMEDFVILKSNGYPTYHFAVVVDDELMHITHVLRAQEHLMNTPKHIALQNALGFRRPIYAHLPIVMNMDGTKMSKRDKHKAVRQAATAWIRQGRWSAADVASAAGVDEAAAVRWLDRSDVELDYAQLAGLAAALGVHPPEIEVHDFRKAGYLPDALLNFIALVGWSPGEDRERMSRDEMVRLFSIERIGKTSAKFDREKLLAFNTDACAAMPPDALRAAFRDFASLPGETPAQGAADSAAPTAVRSLMTGLDDATLDRALAACKGMRTLADVEFKVGALFAPDESLQYDPDAVKKVLAKNEGRGFATLRRVLDRLESLTAWTAAEIDAAVAEFCAAQGLKLGDVAQPIRVAVTGRPISPTLAETLLLLGREKTLRRIRRCLALDASSAVAQPRA